MALVAGDIARGGIVDAPIGRHPVKRTSMAIVASGKPAVTRYEVRERLGDCTLLACRLETGRTHQIRVHLASLGHPLVGDPAYGNARGKAIAFGRQALHAWKLGLVHPSTLENVNWAAPLPADFARLLATFAQALDQRWVTDRSPRTVDAAGLDWIVPDWPAPANVHALSTTRNFAHGREIDFSTREPGCRTRAR